MNVDLGRYKNGHGKLNKLYRLLWCVTWRCLASWMPRWFLRDWRCFLLRIFGAKVGKGCRVSGSAEIWSPRNISIGDNSWIDDHVKLYSVDRIDIGDNCVISEGAFLCTASHDIRSPQFELISKPISIGNCVWVASRAIVLPDTTLGDGCVVACAAIVSRDVDAWTVVAGSPAKIVGKRMV